MSAHLTDRWLWFTLGGVVGLAVVTIGVWVW